MIKSYIDKAASRIREHVRQTPFEKSELISKMTGADVWLKMENQQFTGSFKFRGAINKMLTLDDAQRKSGIYAASTGNHGAAVALASKILGVPCLVYVPENSSEAKLENMKN